MAIRVERTRRPRPRPAPADLGFGQHFTDHVFRADYDAERGWHGARVEPYGPIALDPAAAALHYGQSVFEGLKAFRGADGALGLFRPTAHAARLASSAQRLCMPAPDQALVVEGMKALVAADADWVPDGPGTSLYLRPLLFATEAFLGVRPARSYALVVLASPVGGYFGGAPRRLKLWVERERTRAAPGGVGAVKTGGNYAASLLAAEAARARGCDQVLWTDAATHRLAEEAGTMNFFARLGDAVVTPPLGDTLLAGVTRDSVLTLLREAGVRVEERPLAIDELVAAGRAGALGEAFGTGTASVVAPVGELRWDGGALEIADAGPEAAGERARRALVAIQRGEAPDRHGWVERVAAAR